MLDFVVQVKPLFCRWRSEPSGLPQVSWHQSPLIRLSVPGSFQDLIWPPFCGLWEDPRLKLGLPQASGHRLPFSSFTLSSDRDSGFPYTRIEVHLMFHLAQLEDTGTPDIHPAAVGSWFQTERGVSPRLSAPMSTGLRWVTAH